jgi:hypothetical protein
MERGGDPSFEVCPRWKYFEMRSARAFADEWTHCRNMGDRHDEGPHSVGGGNEARSNLMSLSSHESKKNSKA